MLNIAIVDDEPIFVNSLSNKIIELCNILNLRCSIGKYSNGYDVLENYNIYHIIFLDIEMPSIDGISTAKRINEIKEGNGVPYIIFITSHNELVFDALKSFPYSFICKNNYVDDLFQCLSQVNKAIKFSHYTIMIHSDRKDIILNVEDIIYLEKQKNYVIYYNADRLHKVRSDIDHEYSKLSVYGFIRPHIGYIVNNSAIQYIATDFISLVNGIKVPLNKKYRADVKRKYFKWLGEKDD